MSVKPLPDYQPPTSKPSADEGEPETLHSAAEVEDESPLESLGEAISAAVLGADEEAPGVPDKNPGARPGQKSGSPAA